MYENNWSLVRFCTNVPYRQKITRSRYILILNSSSIRGKRTRNLRLYGRYLEPCVDSDEPVLPPFQLRNSKNGVQSESLLVAHTKLFENSCGGPYNILGMVQCIYLRLPGCNLNLNLALFCLKIIFI